MYQQRSTPVYARKRTAEYKIALAEVKVRKEYEGLSKSGQRRILIEDMEMLLRPLASVS